MPSSEGKAIEVPHYVDYYDTLGIVSSATPREIKNRFMKLARTHHPDRNRGRVSIKMQKEWANYCLAYQCLSDVKQRKGYDENSALRAAVTSFYAKFNPYNLKPEVIEPVLEKYKGHEVQLLNDLHEKYGATPFHKPHTTPPGSPTNEDQQAIIPEVGAARGRSESYPSAREWRNMSTDSPQRSDIRNKIASQAGINVCWNCWGGSGLFSWVREEAWHLRQDGQHDGHLHREDDGGRSCI